MKKFKAFERIASLGLVVIWVVLSASYFGQSETAMGVLSLMAAGAWGLNAWIIGKTQKAEQ